MNASHKHTPSANSHKKRKKDWRAKDLKPPGKQRNFWQKSLYPDDICRQLGAGNLFIRNITYRQELKVEFIAWGCRKETSSWHFPLRSSLLWPVRPSSLLHLGAVSFPMERCLLFVALIKDNLPLYRLIPQLILVFWDRISLCVPGCPGTSYVEDQDDLKLTETPLSLPPEY